MLTEKEKKVLEDKIYTILNESIFESTKDKSEKEKEGKMAKRNSVMKWLNSAQQLHSTLAYSIFNKERANDNEKASARSLFSKKYRGEDAEGKTYYFTDDEINTLYNMKDRFISKIK